MKKRNRCKKQGEQWILQQLHLPLKDLYRYRWRVLPVLLAGILAFGTPAGVFASGLDFSQNEQIVDVSNDEATPDDEQYDDTDDFDDYNNFDSINAGGPDLSDAPYEESAESAEETAPDDSVENADPEHEFAAADPSEEEAPEEEFESVAATEEEAPEEEFESAAAMEEEAPEEDFESADPSEEEAPDEEFVSTEPAEATTGSVTVTWNAGNGYFYGDIWDDVSEFLLTNPSRYREYCTKGSNVQLWPDSPVIDDPNTIFTGWKKPDGTIYPADSEDPMLVNLTKSCTMTAVWGKACTLTLDANGGYFEYEEWNGDDYVPVESPQYQEKREKGATFYLEQPKNKNASVIFVGWSKVKNGDILYEVDEDGDQYPVSEYVPDRSMTLYAVWKNAFTVTLDANGGYFDGEYWDDVLEKEVSGAAKLRSIVAEGDEVSLYQPSINDRHKRFLGWSTKKGGTPLQDADGDPAPYYTPTKSCTLYAVWDDVLIVTFDANGGYYTDYWDELEGTEVNGGSVVHLKVSKGSSLNVCWPDNRDSSREWIGYSLQKNGSPLVDSSGEQLFEYVPTKDCTLYAVWRQLVSKITVPESVTIKVGGETKLTATVAPSNAADRSVYWQSSNYDIAYVDYETGEVYGESEGVAIVTAYANDNGNAKASCMVVVGTAVTKVTLNRSYAELATTKTLQLKTTLSPSNATDKLVTWSSSDPSVATVDKNGLVRAKKYGTVTITARSSNGKTATCAIQTRFHDVNNAGKSYYQPVYWAVNSGITACTVAFRPEDSVTRGEFVAFLWRLSGKQKSTAKVSFNDVNSKTTFYDAIRWAVGRGIIRGYSDNTFRAGDLVTRGEAATMLWRHAGTPAPKTKRSPFSDIKASGADSYKAILWGSENAILKGSDGKFLKNDSCTRGQVVTFLHRYDGN